ncbi:MAG: hypothetical protein DHS20C15_09430 [Planctomycetota bacterium]|nr:MAG: hypothetical protein DHS20C15_09430 [Planctomycetota bacterium]
MNDLRLRVLLDHDVVNELLLSDPLSVGRAADNDLVLHDEAVSSHHGHVERSGQNWIFTDAGSANGSLVAAGPRLRAGDSVPLDELVQIMVGRTVLEFEPCATATRDSPAPRRPAPTTTPPSAPPPAARLVIVEGNDRRLLRLVPPRVLIGRAEDCTVRVSCASVSQHHAELRADADGWLLRDLGSTNGTRVGLVPLQAEKRLASGSHLILGRLDLFFVLDDAAEPEGEQRAFLKWLTEQRELDDAQLEQARAAQAREGCSVDVALVHSGLIEPGRLTELRRQAAHEEHASPADDAEEQAERRQALGLFLIALAVILALLIWLARDA